MKLRLITGLSVTDYVAMQSRITHGANCAMAVGPCRWGPLRPTSWFFCIRKV